MRKNFSRFGAFFLTFLCMTFSHVNAQVIFPTLQKYSKPNPETSAPGDAFSPSFSGVATATTPEIAEWTRSAGPDESIVLTGYNLSKFTGKEAGKDTRFLVYANNATTKYAKIQRIDDNRATITLDKDLPKWSMYLIWPGNEAGYGNPIAVNKTDAWWVGPDKATRGATISVFGRNLAHNNENNTSYVYIKPANGAGQWATVTKVNPYKVDFTVPSNLSNGDYEIWVHNGHGGQYGWSGPLKLTVQDAPQWTNTVFNVKNFGAKGDGYSDDIDAIRAAISAAKNAPGSTVYFPAGTYMVSNTLDATSNVAWKGDGKDQTFIKCATNFSYSAYGLVFGRVNNFKMSDLTLDANRNFRGSLDKPVFLRESNNIWIDNVRFAFQYYDGMDINNSKYVFLTNDELIGKITFLGTCSQLFIDRCAVKLTNDTDMGLYTWGGVGVCMTNTTCQDYNNSSSSLDGWGKGRFFTGTGNSGSNRFTYLGNNTSTDLTPSPYGADQNSGEQFMWEGNGTDYIGSPSASTEYTTSLNGLSLASGMTRFAVIVKGKGLGQSRRIIAYNGSTVTLEEPWNVVPDQSSVITVGRYLDRVVVYNNYLDGKPRAVTNPDHIAATGIEPYGGISNFIAANNTLHELRQGTSNWALQEAIGIHPNYFSLFESNKYIDCRDAIYNASEVVNPVATEALMGTVYRNSTIQNTVGSGIQNEVLNQDVPTINTMVYEHNTFSNVSSSFTTGWLYHPLNVFGAGGLGNQIFYKNNFSGSGQGIQLTKNVSFRENTYQGFTSNYFGTLTDAVIEAPLHVIEMTGNTSGNTVSSTLTIWNSGTSLINWLATSNAPWLTLSANSGTINTEKESSTITLNANSKGLAAGTYTATVTVTSGLQSRAYTVLFTVSATAVVDPVPPTVTLTVSSATTFIAPASVTLSAAASDADGSVSKVEFYNGSTKLGEVLSAPYTFNWQGVAAGSYSITAVATDNSGLSTTSTAVGVTITNPITNTNNNTSTSTLVNNSSSSSSSCSGTGGITWEFWNNQPVWQDITNFPASALAAETRQLSSFTTPKNIGNYYAARTRGYICPPQSGYYTFYISGDDQGELYLSTDDKAANKRMIANFYIATGSDYTQRASQQSVSIYLNAGQRYYIEALHREFTNDDFLTVGWKQPDGTIQNPIAGAHLIPFVQQAVTNVPPTVTLTVSSATTFIAPASVTLSAAASDADGSVSKVEFYNGSTKLGEVLSAPYTFNWQGVAAGSYSITAVATDNSGLSTTSTAVGVTITNPITNTNNNTSTSTLVNNSSSSSSSCSGTGGITWEFWNNQPVWQDITNFPASALAAETRQLSSFTTPKNIGNYYAARTRGYICPPQSGYYTFYISGDDQGELYLSTDDKAANKRMIANFYIATGSDYTQRASQQSVSIYLNAGQRYYIEALHREFTNDDFLTVGWKQPDGTIQNPIAGAHLIPYTATLLATSVNNSQGAIEEVLMNNGTALKTYPNPFQSNITIEFSAAQKDFAKVQLFSLQGNLIATLYEGIVESGKTYKFNFNGSSLASGTYVCRVALNNKIMQQKIILIK